MVSRRFRYGRRTHIFQVPIFEHKGRAALVACLCTMIRRVEPFHFHWVSALRAPKDCFHVVSFSERICATSTSVTKQEVKARKKQEARAEGVGFTANRQESFAQSFAHSRLHRPILPEFQPLIRL